MEHDDQTRLKFNWITLSIDYPYYQGINKDRAIMWDELTDTSKEIIKRDYPELIGSHRRKPSREEYAKQLEAAKKHPFLNVGYPSYEDTVKGGEL